MVVEVKIKVNIKIKRRKRKIERKIKGEREGTANVEIKIKGSRPEIIRRRINEPPTTTSTTATIYEHHNPPTRPNNINRPLPGLSPYHITPSHRPTPYYCTNHSTLSRQHSVNEVIEATKVATNWAHWW